VSVPLILAVIVVCALVVFVAFGSLASRLNSLHWRRGPSDF
jgi:hypothetical protein